MGYTSTRVTSSLVFQFLEAISERLFPPGRVLVVAATHFAVDNFVRVFREISDRYYVLYRFVPHARVEALKNRSIIDSKLYDWSHDYYKSISA